MEWNEVSSTDSEVLVVDDSVVLLNVDVDAYTGLSDLDALVPTL